MVGVLHEAVSDVRRTRRTMEADAVTLTDAIIRKVEEMRPALDRATGRTGISIRAVLEGGTIREVTAKVTQYEERR